MKTCSKCQIEKSLSDFTSRKSGKIASECKRCKADYMNDFYARKEAESPGYMLEKSTRQRLKQYGITLEKYNDLIESQGDRCAICGTDDSGDKRWCIDHDHSCCSGIKSCGECIRGLLCTRCNTAIGMFGDNVDRMMSAAAYIMQRADVLATQPI